jgi:hypothetical protein
VPPAHVCIVLAFVRAIPKVSPAIDHLLRGTTADSHLQAPAGNEIRGASVLSHVVRVLIPHVDHRRANFNLSRLRTNRRKQREW